MRLFKTSSWKIGLWLTQAMTCTVAGTVEATITLLTGRIPEEMGPLCRGGGGGSDPGGCSSEGA